MCILTYINNSNFFLKILKMGKKFSKNIYICRIKLKYLMIMAKRQECVNLLVSKLQGATGKSKTECEQFAIRVIEVFDTASEREKYYQSYLDAIENDFQMFLNQFNAK